MSKKPIVFVGFDLSLDAVVSQWFVFRGYTSNFEGKKKAEGASFCNQYLSGWSIPAAQVGGCATVRPFESWFLRFNCDHRSKRARVEAVFNPKTAKLAYREGEGRVRAIDVFHAVLQLKLRKLNLNLGVENLFNKNYYTATAMINARDAEYVKASG